jgi:WD40 repeat protein
VSGGEDGTLRRWNLATGEPDGTPVKVPGDGVTAVACTVVDGRAVAVTGAADGTVRTWDLVAGAATGVVVQHHEYLPASTVVPVRMDGRAAAVVAGPDEMAYDGEGGYYSGTCLRVWDLATAAPVDSPLPEPDHPGGIACAVIGDHPVVVIGDSEAVHTRRLSDGTPAAPVFDRHDRIVNAVATATVAGRTIAVTGSIFTVWQWDLDTGAAIGPALLDHLGSHHAGVEALCCLTMAGRPVVVAAGQVYADNSGFLRTIDLTTGTPTGPDLVTPLPVSALASIATGGRTLVVGASGDRIHTWTLPRDGQ